ncbi:hypothetical protein U2F10_02685 [Leptothoe sp. EHU-05/26/07-4]
MTSSSSLLSSPTIVYVSYPRWEYCPEPLRQTIAKLAGQLPPKHLAPWPGLISLSNLDDDYATYEAVREWVGRNCDGHIRWFTLGGVVDAAELLVERALENGNLREYTESIAINFYWSSECQGWLDVEESGNGDCHFLVPPNSVENFLKDCGTGFDREAFNDGCEQYCEMNKVLWGEWITALYEPADHDWEVYEDVLDDEI